MTIMIIVIIIIIIITIIIIIRRIVYVNNALLGFYLCHFRGHSVKGFNCV